MCYNNKTHLSPYMVALLNEVTPVNQIRFNQIGIPVDECQLYTKRALQKTQLYKNLPRNIGKSKWTKQQLCTHLQRRDDPLSMIGHYEHMQNNFQLDMCPRYSKNVLLKESEAFKSFVRDFPGTDRLPKQRLCDLVTRRRFEMEQRQNEMDHLKGNQHQLKNVQNDLRHHLRNTQNKLQRCQDEEKKCQDKRNEEKVHLSFHNHNNTDNMRKFTTSRVRNLQNESMKLDRVPTSTITKNLTRLNNDQNKGMNNQGLFTFTKELRTIKKIMLKKVREIRSETCVEVDIAREVGDAVVIAGHAPGFMLSPPEPVRRVHLHIYYCTTCKEHYKYVDKKQKKMCPTCYASDPPIITPGRYIFMEKCGTQHLEHLIRDHYKDPNFGERLKDIMFEVFWSIYAAQLYVQGFRHNDLKPDNIMIKPIKDIQRQYHYYSFTSRSNKLKKCNSEEMPIIIDFGVSSSTLTRTERSLPLSSTEHAAGCRSSTDYAYDVFFFCVTLKHALTHYVTTQHINNIKDILEFLGFITDNISTLERDQHTPENLHRSHQRYQTWMKNRHFIRNVVLDHKIFTEMESRSEKDVIGVMWTITDDINSTR